MSDDAENREPQAERRDGLGEPLRGSRADRGRELPQHQFEHQMRKHCMCGTWDRRASPRRGHATPPPGGRIVRERLRDRCSFQSAARRRRHREFSRFVSGHCERNHSRSRMLGVGCHGARIIVRPCFNSFALATAHLNPPADADNLWRRTRALKKVFSVLFEGTIDQSPRR